MALPQITGQSACAVAEIPSAVRYAVRMQATSPPGRGLPWSVSVSRPLRSAARSAARVALYSSPLRGCGINRHRAEDGTASPCSGLLGRAFFGVRDNPTNRPTAYHTPSTAVLAPHPCAPPSPALPLAYHILSSSPSPSPPCVSSIFV